MREDNYHIIITNLKTGEEQGFMLSGGDTPFVMQGLDSVSTRIIEGEALYSDFTNSKVFSQSSWDKGLSKFWEPEMISYNVYPTKKYRNSKNIKIEPGEFMLGAESGVIKNFPDPTAQVSCLANGEAEGVVYAGIKGICQIWKSTDYGLTWSVYLDLSSDTRYNGYDEVSDIILIKNNNGISGYVSGISLGQGNYNLFFVTWNNTSNEGRISKKKINPLGKRDIIGYVNCRARDNIDGQAPQTDFSVFHQSNTIYNSSVNLNEYTATINWNSGSGPFYVSLTVTGNTPPFFIGSKIQVFYGGSWIDLDVYKTTGTYNTSVVISCSGADSGKTNGDYQVRLKQDVNYITMACSNFSLATNTKHIIFGSLGMCFIYNGYRYYIVGHSLYNGKWASLYKNISNYTSGDLGYHQYRQFCEIYSPDGKALDLIGIADQTVNDFDLFIPENTSYFNKIKKFFTIQSGVYEELLGIRIDTNSVQTIGCQSFSGASVNTNIKHNLYSIQFNSAGSPILYCNNQTSSLNQNHYPVSGTKEYLGSSSFNYKGYVGAKAGINEDGAECYLYNIVASDTFATKPVLSELLTLGEQSIVGFKEYNQDLYFATNLGGAIYKYGLAGSNTGVLEKIVTLPFIIGQSTQYINAITNYNGKIIVGIQKGPGVISIDPNVIDENTGNNKVEVLTNLSIDESITTKITALLNTGTNLLIGTNVSAGELYYYNLSLVADTGWLESSIYGGFIPNIDKLIVYGYIRIDKLLSDEGQKIAVELSFDGGQTWRLCPNKINTPFLTSGVDWNNTDYIGNYDNLKDKTMYTFFVPYNTLFNTVSYKIHLNKGTAEEIRCNHFALHFNLNVKQEIYFNYTFTLKQREELLDGLTIDVDENNRKLTFLKELWTNQNMCIIRNVDGQEYTCMPFNDEKTTGQGLIIQTSNANLKNKDRDYLEYMVNMTFKSIANY